MIQRIQSLWLLLAATAGALTYVLPLWSGQLQDGSQKQNYGRENLFFFALVVATVLLALVTIFMFKNRAKQKALTIIGLLLSILLVALELVFVDAYKKTLNLLESSWQPGALMPIAMMVLFFLAWQGIKKDERLIKSLERLR
jgi:peptidoglycan/LPS O-acetylase OafA/YrhL